MRCSCPGSTSGLTARDRAFVACACITVAVTTSNWAIMATFFPLWAAARGIDPYAVSAIFTSFQIGKLVMSAVSGQCANIFGRRCILIVGLLLVIFSGVALGITPDLAGDDVQALPWLFILPRFLQGCGAGLTQLSIIAILSDTFTKNRGLIVGTASSMEALGYFVGPPFGGWLYACSGFRAPFLVLSTAVALNLVSVVCLHPKRALAGTGTGMACAATVGVEVDTANSGGTSRAANTVNATEVDVIPAASDAPERSAHSHAPLAASWWQQLRHLPVEVWWTCATAVAYMAKWAWWEIHFTEWCVDDFGASIPTASLYIATIAACFGLGVPLAGSMGDRLGRRRLELMGGSMTALTLLYVFMGPWQLEALGPPLRHGFFFVYLAGDGLLCCLIEPQLLPHVLHLAEAERGANEHLTNLVTSLGQSAMNLGMVAGPFVAVPIIREYGFRGALAAWAAPLGLLGLCAGLIRANVIARCSLARAVAPRRLKEQGDAA